MALDGLSFERAEYGTEAALLTFCTWCRRGVADNLYRANGEPICGVCADRAKAILPPNTKAVYWRTTGVGVLTAVGASIAYLQLMRVMERFGGGYGMALGAIAAGYAVGYAMRTTSEGAGGRKYQITAALLVYAAVVVPLAVQLVGDRGFSAWEYPFLLTAPFLMMTIGQFQLGMFALLMVGLGVQWAWRMLPAPGLTITGPEGGEAGETKGLA